LVRRRAPPGVPENAASDPGRTAMPLETLADLTATLSRLRLVEAPRLEELLRQGGVASGDARGLARELVRRGWLTPFQVNELFLGRAESLVLSPYVILDRLGRGGMGEGFKARHAKLGRVVALKVIRTELLSQPGLLERFGREARAAARLAHPNIVTLFDAVEAGDRHFLVLEYVEGTDLDRIVKKNGPLPVDRACDCARQAALG